jgi:predicted O-methyltransferase YrrM
MSNKESLYVMRDANYTNGLLELINHINHFRPTSEMNMIEIGSYSGESTEIFAQRFKSVVAIDPFLNDYDANDMTCQYMDLNRVHEIFLQRISKYGNVNHIRKISDDAHIELLDNSFDFVYIDGLHTYEQVKSDIKNYSPKIIVGGFIGGHDYHPNWSGVMKAIDESLKIDRTFSDTSWITKK